MRPKKPGSAAGACRTQQNSQSSAPSDSPSSSVLLLSFVDHHAVPRRLPLQCYQAVSPRFRVLRGAGKGTPAPEAGPKQGVQDLPLGMSWHFSLVLPRVLLQGRTADGDGVSKNPDEPSKKPTLQSYTIDLNQCGPMVSQLYLLSLLQLSYRPSCACVHRFSMPSSKSRTKWILL